MVLAKFAHRKLKFEKRKNAILNDNHHGLRTPKERFFFEKSQNFGLGQINWAEKIGGIWGIFGQFISIHFGKVEKI